MVRNHYRCANCKRKFLRVVEAVDHKVETGHKINFVFGDTVREAFV